MFSVSLFRSFHEAARQGDIKKLQTRLRKGVDVDTRDDKGRTALYYAARGGHRTLVKLLLMQGADLAVTTGHGDSGEGMTQIV